VTLHSHIQLLDSNLRESIEVLFAGAQRAADLTYVLAKETNFPRFADHAYLGALMQDAGTLVLLMRSGARALEHKANDGHTALGASLMRNWKMPPLISTVVGVHHRPTEAERAGSEAFAISCLLAAGRRLRDGDSDEWQSEWASRVKETLGIGEEVLQGVMVKLIATQAE
jgi:HD-like signal output (HDOD) protein